MQQLNEDLIREIRNSVDIVDVISSYIELTPKGRNFFGVCPFHDDTNPSMSVSKEKQIYTCFSCHATGNVFKFLMDYENISFIEAVKKCADMANISLDIKNYSNTKDNTKNSVLYDIYENSTKFYQNLINTSDGKSAKEYLLKRNIDEELIKEFKIGLSLEKRDLLTKFLTKNNYTKNDLLKSGLVIENSYGLNDIYANRIMFPLEDLNGRVVGFSGRIYNTTDNSKYINTKETEIFKKREMLYNYRRAKDDARQKGYVIVMEGFMDVIRAYSVGIKNVVATMGTAITSNHAMALKKMAKDIYLCFDGDSAGLKATISCIEELDKVGVTPKIIRLEENLDPDEYIIKYGKDRFLQKIDDSMNVIDFKMNYFKEINDITKLEDKAKYVNLVLKELSKIDDDILLEMSLKKLSIDSSLEIDFLKEKLNDIKNEKPVKEIIVKEEKNNKISGLEKAEIYLVYYMLNSKDVIKMYDRKVTHIPDSKYRILAHEISEYYHKYENINISDFLDYISEYEDILETVNDVLSRNISDEYTLEDIEGYINKISKSVLKEQMNRLNERIKNSTDYNEKLELIEKLSNLKKQEQEI